MIRMLSAFNLKPGEDETAFRAAYQDFITELHATCMILAADPPGRRVRDTPMDTGDNYAQEFFSIMCFRNRAQLDEAYAHIEERMKSSTTATHLRMYRRITNSVFLCWEEDAE